MVSDDNRHASPKIVVFVSGWKQKTDARVETRVEQQVWSHVHVRHVVIVGK